jgi:predicted DNA-binding protein
MLSVRLPEDLDKQLSIYCKKQKLQKSKVVQAAIRKHLKSEETDPFLSLVGSGNGKYTTEQIMKMSRGDDWNAA